MKSTDLILAAMAAGGADAQYGPAQVQKLFFLIDREIPDEVDGPHFAFEPYDYGPFDASLYRQLDILHLGELVKVNQPGRYRRYALTTEGYEQGTKHLKAMNEVARDFTKRSADWVRAVSFQQLVSAIYKQYPEMKAKSIFRA